MLKRIVIRPQQQLGYDGGVSVVKVVLVGIAASPGMWLDTSRERCAVNAALLATPLDGSERSLVVSQDDVTMLRQPHGASQKLHSAVASRPAQPQRCHSTTSRQQLLSGSPRPARRAWRDGQGVPSARCTAACLPADVD